MLWPRSYFDIWNEQPRIDWVIVGGESGPGARPMHPQWVRDLRDQCVAAGVPFFFKQWGEWGPSWRVERVRPAATRFVDLDGGVHPLDETLRPPSGWCGMNRAGKASAGRELEGRTWDETPDTVGER